MHNAFGAHTQQLCSDWRRQKAFPFMHISIYTSYAFRWCRNADHKFFSWKLCTCRFRFEGLYLYLFFTFAPLFHAFAIVCLPHPQATGSRNQSWLFDFGQKYYSLFDARPFSIMFNIIIFFTSTPTPRKANYRRRHFFHFIRIRSSIWRLYSSLNKVISALQRMCHDVRAEYHPKIVYSVRLLWCCV